jgi:hypothetical protein
MGANVRAVSELLRDLHGGAVLGATVRVRWIVERQWGVIARWQLLDCGVGRGQIESWIARGLLIPVHSGVYAFGHGRIPVEGRLVAALLYAGKGAGLSDATGLWWYELIPDQPPTISVSAPGRRSSLPGVDVHHPRTLELTRHRQFPIVTVARAFVDYAATATDEQLRLALSEADYRGRLDLDAIHAAMGRGHEGSAKLAHALKRHEPGSPTAAAGWSGSSSPCASATACRCRRSTPRSV